MAAPQTRPSMRPSSRSIFPNAANTAERSPTSRRTAEMRGLSVCAAFMAVSSTSQMMTRAPTPGLLDLLPGVDAGGVIVAEMVDVDWAGKIVDVFGGTVQERQARIPARHHQRHD